MKYRKKPVEIEAIQFTRDCFENIRIFTNGKASKFITERRPNGKSYCKIETLEGVMTATEGDFIIKGVNGEFYPCKPDIFEKTYEPISKKSNNITVELDGEAISKAVINSINQNDKRLGNDMLNI